MAEEDDIATSSDGNSEGEDELEELAAPKANAVYNTEALHEKLEDISWPTDIEWLESLVVPADEGMEVEKVDASDDLVREAALYAQALAAAQMAYTRLQEKGVPVLRPSDYYAEMVKGDAHMERVRSALLAEQRQLAEAEERRKQRQTKRYAKEVQAEKLKERAKEKKDSIESVKKWRKDRENSGYKGGEEDFPVDLQGGGMGGGRGERSGKGMSRGQEQSKGSGGISKKRQSKNTKFGFGGRKRLIKQNDADSAGDMSDFKANKRDRRFEKGRKGAGTGKSVGGNKGKVQRPGKARRQQMRSKT